MPGYFMASFYPVEMGGGGGGDAPVDRAIIASRNHREAEKRRRERIKSHLDRLRTILACDPKVRSKNIAPDFPFFSSFWICKIRLRFTI